MFLWQFEQSYYKLRRDWGEKGKMKEFMVRECENWKLANKIDTNYNKKKIKMPIIR